MRFKFFLFLFIYIWLLGIGSVMAEEFIPIENEFTWLSPNLVVLPSTETKNDQFLEKTSAKKSPLGGKAYNKNLDSLGVPPPLDFLRPLKKQATSFLGAIKDGYIVFRKNGKKITLNRPRVPSWAEPADPYLLTIPNVNRVFVVYPYYLLQNKEFQCFVEMYSDSGVLLAKFDTLPSHSSVSNPYLLVSPERSGCCESMKWSIRFYNLREGSVSEYSCPEGFCGDVLFTKVGDNGPFIIVQEIVGKVDEIGASMQTNFYVVENDGRLSASGKTLYAIREPNISKPRLESLSPYAIANLISMDPLAEENSWIIHFATSDPRNVLKLTSTYKDPTPSMVFLLPKDTSTNALRTIRGADGQSIGTLPQLGASKAGVIVFEVSFKDGHKENIAREINPDSINILFF